MSTVEEIKAAIANLDGRQVAELADWLLHRCDDAWDEQMVADVSAGKLDHLVQAAEQSAQRGQVYGLPGSGKSPPADNEAATRK